MFNINFIANLKSAITNVFLYHYRTNLIVMESRLSVESKRAASAETALSHVTLDTTVVLATRQKQSQVSQQNKEN